LRRLDPKGEEIMNRFALIFILAAMPLVAAGMLAQSENVSGDASANALSAAANFAPAKQFFRGYWTDDSNFTQDASYLADGFSAVGNFHGAVDQIDFNSRRTAAEVSHSHVQFQPSEKKLRLAATKVTGAEAQLAQFNALYASLTHGGHTHFGEVSLSVYHQLMDQELLAGKHARNEARPRTAFNSIANLEKKPAGFSSAELEMVRMTAQHTEHEADVQAVTATRLKKAMQPRGHLQRPATPQRNHQTGEAAPTQTQQNPVVAIAMTHYAGTRQNISGGLTELKNLQRMNHVEVSVSGGTDNSSDDTIGFQNVPGECGHGK
jgi:hypothetical protein